MKPIVIATLISLTSSQVLLAGELSAKDIVTGITVSGYVQTEVRYNNDFNDVDSSDIVVDEINFTIDGQVHKFAKTTLSFKYEEDITPLEVDNAYLTLSSNSPLYLKAGQLYVPFGNFSTHMVSDSLTHFAETRETAVQLGIKNGGVYGSIYGFNGINNARNTIDHYGLNLGFSLLTKPYYNINKHNKNSTPKSFDMGIGYISDIGDADSLEGFLTNTVDYDYIDATNVYVNFSYGTFSFMGEYIAALDNFKSKHIAFNGTGAKIHAYDTEIGLNFNLAGYNTTVAIGYQVTEEALALQLPESRIIGILSTEIYTNTSLSLEYALNKDYSEDDGGTGKDSNSVILQLAVKF